jgi:NAD(P)-dependent dehydrogenase (short-subunit alcohol dehydrogenase family)
VDGLGLLDGKVAVVTGSGRGIGRGEALELAAQGAKVVVNAPGHTPRGEPEPDGAANAADEVVSLIRDRGGEAVASYADVGDWVGARSLVEEAVSAFGRLDILVNNAGVNRKRPIVDLAEEDWDAVMRVHLKGTFACTQHAARYWRAKTRANGPGRYAIVNTLAISGILPTLTGGAAYASAKGALAVFTIVSSLELAEYGVRVNAISPNAYTRLTASLSGRDDARETDSYAGFDPRDPGNPAPLVAWLASEDAGHVSGQVFWAGGDTIRHFHGWGVDAEVRTEGRWDAAAIGDALNTVLFRSKAPRMDWEVAVQARLGSQAAVSWSPPSPSAIDEPAFAATRGEQRVT